MRTDTQSPNQMEAYILYGIGFLFLPVAAIANAQIWVLAVTGVTALLAFRAVQGRILPAPNVPLVALLALLVGWAGLSIVWSINPDRAITTAIRLALVALSLIVLIDAASKLTDKQRRRFGVWLVAGTICGLLLTAVLILFSGIIPGWLGMTKLTGRELSGLNRTSSVIALLVWPVALVIAQIYGRYAAAATIILSAILLFTLAPSTPVVAFAIGVLAFSIAWASHRWGKRFLLVAFACAVIMIPLLDVLAPPVVDFLVAFVPAPNSEIHRIAIWQFAAEQIFNHPLIGWGLDSSRAIPGGHEKILLFQNNAGIVTGQAMPLHPHNAIVQIWLELGLVGVLLMGGIFSLIVTSIPEYAKNRAGPATMIAVTACGFAIAQLGFGIWQGWWMATLGLMVMIVVAAIPVTHHSAFSFEKKPSSP